MSGVLVHEPAMGAIPFVYRVDRSDRQRARIVVDPHGEVEVRAPRDYDDSQVEALVRRRVVWILRQRARADAYRPREPRRTYQSGESIRYLGRQYRLRVEATGEGRPRIRGRHLVARVESGADREAVRSQVTEWLRNRARVVLQERFERCAEIAGRHGIAAPTLQLRLMTRRWGSCTPSGRILLNPKLVQTPSDCIDYVILHEHCHLRVSRHGARFYRLLDLLQPDWRRRKARLDRISLPEW